MARVQKIKKPGKTNKPIRNKRISNMPKNEQQSGEKKVVYIEGMNVADLALSLKVSNAHVIKQLMTLGVMASINDVLDRDSVELIADDLGYEVVNEVITDKARYDEFEIIDDEKDLVKRPPIVTVMGHVDHGKTTLLDALRSARVAAGESGGITQHIGAYQIERKNNPITFIDTPGHAAFTEMRIRGAKVTDLCILVVAADDGVMPQTVEAIDHIKAAKVPIIVAVNKIDKPTANVDNVMSGLSQHGLVSEQWGGDVPFVEISAKQKIGLEELLDVIDLMSEINEFKANPKRHAKGSVIEARLDRGRGVVATLIVETGTLRVGDNLVCGNTYGKVRTMEDDLNNRLTEALPSMPIEITGLNEMPEAGDIFMVFEDERTTRQIAEERQARAKELELKTVKKRSLDRMFGDLEAEEKELNIIIKGDVQGSIEALKGLLEKIDVEGFHVNVVRSTVGAITENDVTLAVAAEAIIIGFNVRPTANVRRLAENQGIEIRLYSVIYKVQEDIILALKGMLEPVFEEKIIGQAEIREVFKISRLGSIAGGYVTDGIIKRDALVRVIREGIVVYEGKLASLKRFKDDVREVRTGYECGFSIENYNDIKVGDIVEVSEMQQVEEK